MTFRLLIPFAVLGAALAQGPAGPPNGPMQRPQDLVALKTWQAHVTVPALDVMQPPQDLVALKTYLNLTDAQVRQMHQAGEQARRQADEKAKALEPQIREKRMALQDLLAKDTSDATAVGKLMLEIRGLEKQMRESRQAVRAGQLAVLTADQRTKFRAIEEAAALPQATREAMQMGLVPGAPGGPNPPRMGQGQPNGPPMPPQPRRGQEPGPLERDR